MGIFPKLGIAEVTAASAGLTDTWRLMDVVT